MVKAKIILNPYARRWTAKQRIPEVKAALQAAGVEFDLSLSEAPGHAIDLAEEAAYKGFDLVVAAGGDGTISEVVNGLCRAYRVQDGGCIQMPLGVLPLGSANDLVVNLGLPRDLKGAAAILPAARQRWIDLGHLRYLKVNAGAGEWGECFFDNNSAIGLEPSITLIQQEITWLHGTLRYLLATLIGIARNPTWQLQLEWEGGAYQGNSTLVTVGNNPLTGGLFYMTPHADPADGKLTFVHGYMKGRPQILKLLPRTMKPGAGSYVEHPSIHEAHTTWLKIVLENPTPVHADGEIQSRAVKAVEYRLFPACLPVIIP